MVAPSNRPSVASLVGLAAALSLLGGFASPGLFRTHREAFASGEAPALPKPPDKLSWDVLKETDFADLGDGDKNRPFFNAFSWRTFIALNWPGAAKRGEPDKTKEFGDTSVPTVWEEWKTAADLFPADAATKPPLPWDDLSPGLWVRAQAAAAKGKRIFMKRPLAGKRKQPKVLVGISKLEDINQAGFNVIENPLVAQNKTYVRYEIHMNRVAYDFVRDNQFYLRDKLPPMKVEFPDQSINVKAAWMELPDDEKVRKRFYHVAAKVLDWDPNGKPILGDRVVGLIGFHIVHKTPMRKNWIWSTFEHVDNTDGPSPSLSSKAGLPFGSPGTNEPPDPIAVGKPIPKPTKGVEVARKDAVHALTERINKAYQEHPRIKDTVWKNYRLVVTQWPTPPGNGPVGQRFPKDAANVTMETYHQDISCLSCHGTAIHAKFVFYPGMRAVDASGSTDAPRAMKNLQKLLKAGRGKPKSK